MKGEIITFKVSEDFKKHIVNQAVRKKLKLSDYVREVLKRHSKYKEKQKEIIV